MLKQKSGDHFLTSTSPENGELLFFGEVFDITVAEHMYQKSCVFGFFVFCVLCFLTHPSGGVVGWLVGKLSNSFQTKTLNSQDKTKLGSGTNTDEIAEKIYIKKRKKFR